MWQHSQQTAAGGHRLLYGQEQSCHCLACVLSHHSPGGACDCLVSLCSVVQGAMPSIAAYAAQAKC